MNKKGHFKTVFKAHWSYIYRCVVMYTVILVSISYLPKVAGGSQAEENTHIQYQKQKTPLKGNTPLKPILLSLIIVFV